MTIALSSQIPEIVAKRTKIEPFTLLIVAFHGDYLERVFVNLVH